MNIEQMRTEVIKVYLLSDSWADRVKKMSDTQVTAIFLRFKREGKI